jgi:hypothetical protein
MRIIIAVLFSISVPSWASEPITGNDLMEWVPAFKSVQSLSPEDPVSLAKSSEMTDYVLGVSDKLVSAGAVCFPADTTSSQIVTAFIMFLERHPQRWNEDGEVLVTSSLKAYRCPKG